MELVSQPGEADLRHIKMSYVGFGGGVLVLGLLSYAYGLQRFGIYDYFDGIRYLGHGVSLLSEGRGAPIPIEYVSEVQLDDFATAQVQSYPGLMFQVWAAVTAGANGLLSTSLYGAPVYIVNCFVVALIALRFLPAIAAFGVLCVLCLGPVDNIFMRVSIRPLPDTFLMLSYSLAIFCALKQQPAAGALSAAAGSLFRFQGALFVWTVAWLYPNSMQKLRYLLLSLGIFAFGTVALSLVGPGGEHSGGNASFYINAFLAEPLNGKLSLLWADIALTFVQLVKTREFQIYLGSAPVVLAGWWVTRDTGVRRFLLFSVFSSLFISFVSYHALTVTAHEGWTERYLVYPWPSTAIALAITCVEFSRKLGWSVRHLSHAIVAMCVLYFGYSMTLVPSFVPFWEAHYLPEKKLSALPSEAVIGLAAAKDESAYEVYSVARSRRMMWLPERPEHFLSSDNGNVDYLVIGGYWHRGEETAWKKLAARVSTITDAGGNVFSPLFQTEHYWIMARLGTQADLQTSPATSALSHASLDPAIQLHQ